MATRDEDIDLESGEFVSVGHIWKFDLEKYGQRNFGVKCKFSKIQIEPVMLNLLAKTENLRNARSEPASEIQSRESSEKKQREITIRNFQI